MATQAQIEAVKVKDAPISVKFFELVNDLQLTQSEAANVLGLPFRTQVTVAQRPTAPRETTTPRTPRVSTTPWTFGVEMETVSPISREALAQKIAQFVGCQSERYNHNDHADHVYKIVQDGSVHGNGYETSAEVVSPILNNFDTLKKVCNAVNEAGCKVNRTCGLHVHIGAQNITLEHYKNVFINYALLEAAIDKFMAESRRKDNAYYAQPVRGHVFDIRCARSIQDIADNVFDGVRYFKVNPQSYSRHQTIEFRQHQGSTNFAKIKAWVNFLQKLVSWSESHRLETDVENINDIPFLTNAEKRYFNERANELA